MLGAIGELLFSLAVSYMGALEFLFVVRHLCHWSMNHGKDMLTFDASDDESLKRLQDQLKREIAEAKGNEIYGLKAMKDGVLYKDGFRIDIDKEDVEILKREIIGSSRNSLDLKDDEERAKIENQKREESEKSAVEESTKTPQIVDEVREEAIVKKQVDNREANSESSRHEEEELVEVYEEPIVKKHVFTDFTNSNEKSGRKISEDDSQADDNEPIVLTQTMKTQYGQTLSEQYSGKSGPNLEVQNSAESSSIEPESSQKSSFSTQMSSSVDAPVIIPEMHFEEFERQAPDGEDVPQDGPQYSEEYLRSLDGIKHRPLVRDDGTGRRRAFKKRRSSGSSTSSRESRASREEELKMFTSLEEQEFETIRKGESEYGSIKYSSDPNLKVAKHHRRHKRSPVKETKRSDREDTVSLNSLEEEETNPWGEIKPEHYKDTAYWKREKTLSIEEEDIPNSLGKDNEMELPTIQDNEHVAGEEIHTPAQNIPKLASFEDATPSQHEEAISTLNQQRSIEDQPEKSLERTPSSDAETKNVSSDALTDGASLPVADDELIISASASDNNALLEGEKPQLTEDSSAVACNQADEHAESHAAGGLRRSPRMDEIDHYEERWEDEKRRESQSVSPGRELESRASDETEETHNRAKRSLSPENAQPSHPVIEVVPPTDEEQQASKISILTGDDDDDDIEDDDRSYVEDNEYLTEGVSDFYHQRSKSCTPEILRTSTDKEGAHGFSPARSTSPNPIIEVECASDEENLEEEGDYKEDTSGLLLEGISDFYDFNASINPSRSKSRSISPEALKAAKGKSKSKTPRRSASPFLKNSDQTTRNKLIEPIRSKSRSQSLEPLSSLVKSRSPQKVYRSAGVGEGLSDFYDFNRDLNAKAYGGSESSRRLDAHRTSVDYILDDLKDEKESKSEPTLTVTISKNETPSLREEEGGGQLKSESSIEELQTPTTPDYARSISFEMRDVERIKEELISNGFQRSTYVGESMDFSDKYDNLREEAKQFTRSRSKSRSPYLDEESMYSSSKKELQEKILEEITKTTLNFQDFSADMNKNFLEHERRASDSALIPKPEILIQIQDNADGGSQFTDDDELMNELDAEEYHHFRRFSLNQEYQVEEYPEDDDYMYIQQIEVRSLSSLQEDYYGERNYEKGEDGAMSVPIVSIETVEDREVAEDDGDDSGSDDERQTVVEVDDEIDEDIWDFNERPEESYNEQSECEEADREVDRYANRNATDWKDEGLEGAVGGVLDEDSREIEKIYEEAVKNRKQSGLMRDYDSILQGSLFDDSSSSIKTEDLLEEILREEDDKYALSPNSRSSRASRASSRESTRSFLEGERRENERRYLGDPNLDAIQSTRLRSRYGIAPAPIVSFENVDDVDLSYVPKKEYKWRKNFKLDDDGDDKRSRTDQRRESDYSATDYLEFDDRKFSLGGESVTLYSRSPDRFEEENGEYNRSSFGSSDIQEDVENYENYLQGGTQAEKDLLEYLEKASRKKKTKKSRKGSKGSLKSSDSGEGSRRGSLIDGEVDKKVKRVRKGSKGSVNSNESAEVSRRGSVIDGVSEAAMIEENQIIEVKKEKKERKKKSRNGSKASLEELENGDSFGLRSVNEADGEVEENVEKTEKKIKKKKKKSKAIADETLTVIEPLTSENDNYRLDPIGATETNDFIQNEKRNQEASASINSFSAHNDQFKENPLSELSSITEETISSSNETKPNADLPENATQLQAAPSESPEENRRAPLQRQQSSGVYELIKDGSMYPWF